ncbi:hypothetical protein KR52_10005 [Synechococcus sp. KORDI-52]|uniref:hypothetical protein n=1 Tax=Synechococcus sp. KORDI-52 TaxID=585425 RepID=UPI0004E08799|nr:hypothetical protein [Synechococcus sp. KORDI-52]AII49473.1 hypothetical protein KR52_10005 [Synechococcus sp. KORDI-52]
MYRDEIDAITSALKAIPLDRKSQHLSRASEYFVRAKELIEMEHDWQASGSMILKALAEERKSENTGLQVMNVIKFQKPKTKLEFKFRS